MKKRIKNSKTTPPAAAPTPQAVETAAEIELTHVEALDRQLLIDSGFAVAHKTNSKGQPVEITINAIGLFAAIIRALRGGKPSEQRPN